jgi:hypothetical protein
MDAPSPSTSDRPLTRAEVEQLLRHPNRLMSEYVWGRQLPQLAASVRTADLTLTVRVQNCLSDLRKHHGLADLSYLSHFTIGQLLRLRNFGRKPLIDLLSAVLPVILEDTTDRIGGVSLERQEISRAITKAAERLRAQPHSSRVRCTDPRFRLEAGTLLFAANSCSDDPPLDPSASLHDVAHRLVGRMRDNAPQERTLDAIGKIRRKIARVRRLPLERELQEISREFASGRNLDLALSFFGWSGHGVRTLQAVGDDFHMTRERVRQITSKLIARIGQARPFAPTLKRAIIHISRGLPAAVVDIETELCGNGLTQAPFRLDGIASAAELFGVSVPFTIEGHHGIQTVVRHEATGLAKSIVRFSRKVVSHAGLGKVADLCDLIEEEAGTAVDSPIVRRVLQSLTSLHWLDQQSEWFFIDDLPRNHLVTLVTKVLAVAPTIHVNEMRSAIARDHRGMGFAPPKSVVLEFCRIACKCKIDGDNIVAMRAPSPAEALSKSEQLAYSVLAADGPLLHRSDFERKCIERGMNPNTFLNYVGRLPILARFGPGIYGLRGAAIAPGDVERRIPPAARRFHDHGWTPDARPWLAVELSSAALSSGVITVPSGVMRFIEGRYLLRTQDGSEVGTLVISGHSGWGLRPLFRRRGGEAGDVLVLTFDLQRHEAAVRLGTKEDVFTDLESPDPGLS